MNIEGQRRMLNGKRSKRALVRDTHASNEIQKKI